jgi:hypothetical protein
MKSGLGAMPLFLLDDLLSRVTFFFFLAGLVQKSSVMCMLVCPNGQKKTRFIWLSKVENKQ